MTPSDTGTVPVHVGTRTPVVRDEDLHEGTIPLPTFARRPSTHEFIISSGHSAEFYGRLQISGLQFDKFQTPFTFLCWKIRLKTIVTTCSDFPSEAMLWIKEVEMVNSLEELKPS